MEIFPHRLVFAIRLPVDGVVEYHAFYRGHHHVHRLGVTSRLIFRLCPARLGDGAGTFAALVRDIFLFPVFTVFHLPGTDTCMRLSHCLSSSSYG